MKKMKLLILLIIILAIGLNILDYPVDDKYTLDETLLNQVSSTVPGYTKLNKIPRDLKNAIIAVEDRRFFTHYGVDVIGIGRAFLTNIKEGEIAEGGSTITQQLVKNLFLKQDKSYARKVKEIALSVKLENMFNKDQILEMYLNVIYFGAGAYGVQNASMTYFNKNIWELSTAESAMLVGLPQAPSVYNPKVNFSMAKKRQEYVLQAMVDMGYPARDMEKAREEKVVVVN